MDETGPEAGALTAEESRALVAHTSDAISIVDEEGTIRYQSPGSEHVKGWPPEELVGENVLEYVHPDDRDRVTEEFAGLTTESGPIETEIEFRFRRADGEWIWLAVKGVKPAPESPIDGYVTTSRDVTDRVTYERRLEEQLDGLDILNQVLRHDIRNDLQVISAYAELLADQVETDGEDYAETLQEKTDHAVALTRTARDVADVMLATGEDREPVALRSVLEREIDNLRSTYPGAAVTVEDALPEVSVLADDMLDSVFRNLLKNAVQHNDKEVPEIDVSARNADGRVVVEIADNGPGIPDDQKEEVFGKGEKGLESDGTGLGLYLVRTLVEAYDGEIEIRDNDPEGAVFVLELPTLE